MRLLLLHSLPALTIAVIAGNVILTGWALAVDLRRRRLDNSFWALLLIVLALLVVQIASGALLAVGGARPRRALHFLYGVLVTGVGGIQFGLRPGGFLRPTVIRDPTQFREPLTLALLCFTQAALILRAYTTGAFGR